MRNNHRDNAGCTRNLHRSEQVTGGVRYTNVCIYLTEEAPMVSIPRIIGVMSCSLMLCLSLSNVTQADDKHRETQQGIYTIKGKVLRVDGDDYLVRVSGGKEVSLRVDSATEMS